MWSYFKNRFKEKGWTNKKIAFVSILIAASVAFVLLMTSILPFLVWPSLKISIGGLPIKLTGYIFGPIIGAVTGLISDLLSFALKPVFYHWWYTLAFICVGLIPGIVGFFMNRRWKSRSEIVAKHEQKIDFVNFVITLVILLIVTTVVTVFVLYGSDKYFKSVTNPGAHKPIVSSKWAFLAISLGGVGSMFVGVFVMVLTLKKKTFNQIIPIIAFSALIELLVVPMITLGDLSAFGTKEDKDFITLLTTHLLLSPFKIWINMLVIYFAFRIVSPLVYNKTDNGWEDIK